MLENDSTEQSDPQEAKHSVDEPEGTVKKPRKRRRRLPAKKPGFLAGLWPKTAIVAIILCLAFASFIISMLTRSTTIPVIQNISVSDIAQTSAIINWQTNEPTTSEITICSSDNCTSLKKDESLVTNHSATLTDIEPNIRYQLTIVARNKQGKEAKLTLEFITPAKANTLSADSTAVKVGTEIGKRAPDFTLPTIDGKEASLSQFKGKIVLINFWASTCSGCSGEMPDLQAVFDTWSPDDLEILAVNDGEREVFVQSFIDSRGLTFPILLDSDGAVFKLYQISTIPTTVFIDADGIIRRIKSGRFASQSEIENMLKSL